jgi:DNA ligase D-like protein (predicted ligase)
MTKMFLWKAPMLATLSKRVFSDKNWIYEEKYDGMRCLVRKEGKNVILYSRNRKKINRSFPELEKALKKQKNDFFVDGEIVAFSKHVTSFEKGQGRLLVIDEKKVEEGKKIKIYFYVFDVLFFEKNLTKSPLIDRKKALRKAIKFNEMIRFSEFHEKEGEKYFQIAKRRKWEGIIAKRRDSFYLSKRSTDWLKMKCVRNQELVIGGFTDPEGKREGFGALLVGYYENGKFCYAGKVGTGYSFDLLKSLAKRLKKVEVEKNCFSEEILKKGVHFVKPEVVAEIGFTEWTRARRLRHPRFLGIRTDKAAKEVVFEKEI